MAECRLFISRILGRPGNGLSLRQPFGKVRESLGKQPLGKGQVPVNLGVDFDVWQTRGLGDQARDIKTRIGVSGTMSRNCRISDCTRGKFRFGGVDVTI